VDPWRKTACYWWLGALLMVGLGLIAEPVMRQLLKPPLAWYLWDYGREGFRKVVLPDGSLPANLETGLIRDSEGKALDRHATGWGNQVSSLVVNRALETRPVLADEEQAIQKKYPKAEAGELVALYGLDDARYRSRIAALHPVVKVLLAVFASWSWGIAAGCVLVGAGYWIRPWIWRE
jgi:hypothetical protein